MLAHAPLHPGYDAAASLRRILRYAYFLNRWAILARDQRVVRFKSRHRARNGE
jgi:hypothetical protein